MGKLAKKITAAVVVTLLLMQNFWVPINTITVKAEEDVDFFTDYLPQITKVTDADSGFTHPGVGLTKDILENVRTMVRGGEEPWNSYFNAMLVSSAAATNVTSSNESGSDSSVPGTYAFNSQGVQSKFIADALKAYTQALLYYITGNEVYRSNAMHIIRIWSQMDPEQYTYYTDACIHTGIPLNRMVTAAEILRYSSCETDSLKWTEEDTKDFTDNLITPAIETFQHDQNHFMNQHSYPLMGAMAGYIFTDNLDRYKEAVEWFTINSSAADQGFNGSIKQLFRWVDTEAVIGQNVTDGTSVEGHVQHVEMGRDQAHGGGDLTNAVIISRMLLAEGTKIDPTYGTVSTGTDAVGPYEFLNNRILSTADYFWQYMLGYDTPWTKVAYSIESDGTVRDTYNYISPSYRGRFNTANFWDLYSYYTYTKGEDVSELAPYYYEAFTKKLPSNYYYGGSLSINWNNVDGGGDFWLYLPFEAKNDADIFLPKEQTSPYIIEVENRYTAFDENTESKDEGDGTSYVRFHATETGSKIALLNASTSNKTIGFMVRSNGVSNLRLNPSINDSLLIPDTNGEWCYVTYTMGSLQSLGDILYLTVTGDNDTTVDIDYLNVNAGTLLTPPVFLEGNTDQNLVVCMGTPISLDFSAVDEETEVLTYEGSNLPVSAALNSESGVFTWQPSTLGVYTFTVAVSDNTTVTAKNVTITVAKNREEAIEESIKGYDADKIYTKSSLDAYITAYNETLNMIESGTDIDFMQQLRILSDTSENLSLVTPLLGDGSFDYHDVVYDSTFSTSIINLVDNNPGTFASYGLATNKSHIIDFGPDYKVSATAFGFQSNIFADRLAGSAVFGSNDGITWTRLTPELTAFTQDYQTLEVADSYKDLKFRFFKIGMLTNYPDIIHNTVQNLFEIAEFRIFGQRYEVGNQIETISMYSEQSVNGKVSLGDTIKLSITAKEEIQNVRVKIQGINALVSTTDNLDFIAAANMDNAATGTVNFSIDYQKGDGSDGDTIYLTTDDSSLFLVDGAKRLDVPLLADVTASDVQWPGNGLSKEKVGYLLFDGDVTTYGDLNTSTGSYYTVDFGEGVTVSLSEILLMPRASYYSRMNGLIIQGSNDNLNWTDITDEVAGATEKQWFDISYEDILDHGAYRYFKIYNAGSWNGDVAEVEFYGDYNTTADTLALKIKDIDNPLSGANSLTLPSLPSGYALSIKSSSKEFNIALDNTITTPEYDTLVALVLTVTKLADGTSADTGNITVLVPGIKEAEKIDVTLQALLQHPLLNG